MNMLPLGEIRGLTKLIKTTVANSCAKAAITPSTSIGARKNRRRFRVTARSSSFSRIRFAKTWTFLSRDAWCMKPEMRDQLAR
jgi:hypothetical protein